MINTNKELNNERKQNILNLLNKCKETDKNFKQFASESHKYKLNPPINKNKVRKVLKPKKPKNVVKTYDYVAHMKQVSTECNVIGLTVILPKEFNL